MMWTDSQAHTRSGLECTGFCVCRKTDKNGFNKSVLTPKNYENCFDNFSRTVFFNIK